MPSQPLSLRGAATAAALAVLAAMLLLDGVTPRAADTKSSPPPSRKEAPKVKLKASTQAGFVPLEILFAARIENVSETDAAFCHAGTMLALRLPGGEFRNLAGEDPVCLHPPEQRDVTRTFHRTFIVERPGVYEFVWIVLTNDGERLISNGVPVRVLASPSSRYR